jgi:hypothetical protein
MADECKSSFVELSGMYIEEYSLIGTADLLEESLLEDVFRHTLLCLKIGGHVFYAKIGRNVQRGR